MSLKTAHSELLQAALLTAAETPGRSTGVTGISASSSVSISQPLWPCLSYHDPPSLMSTDGHQMDNTLACTTGQPLALLPRRLILLDCVCASRRGKYVCFITTLIIIQCSHSDNTKARWPTQPLLLLLPLPALPFNWSFSS